MVECGQVLSGESEGLPDSQPLFSEQWKAKLLAEKRQGCIGSCRSEKSKVVAGGCAQGAGART